MTGHRQAARAAFEYPSAEFFDSEQLTLVSPNDLHDTKRLDEKHLPWCRWYSALRSCFDANRAAKLQPAGEHGFDIDDR